MTRRVRAALSVLVATALLVTGCSGAPTESGYRSVEVTTNPPAQNRIGQSVAGYPKLGGTEPGSLIAVEPFDTVEPRLLETGAKAFRIRYLSTPAVGSDPVEVTGSVFVPGGTPPAGGWQLVAFNHGNTGISPDCGPSLYDDLQKQWLPIGALLLNGYMVVASDYEGLGGPGGSGLRHALLDSTALGHNVIDGVRAARAFSPDVGTRWASFGGSLGGLATWASNELAGSYGTGLDLVGAATWVPVVDASALPAKAARGELTQDQKNLYFQIVMSLKATTHPEMQLTDYLRGEVYDNRDKLVLCTGRGVNSSSRLINDASSTELTPSSPAAVSLLQGWLEEYAVPKQKTTSPMIVIYGSADKLVDQAWIDAALQRGCAQGDSISWFLRPGEGHGDIDASQAFSWLFSRFDGQEPVDMCVGGDR